MQLGANPEAMSTTLMEITEISLVRDLLAERIAQGFSITESLIYFVEHPPQQPCVTDRQTFLEDDAEVVLETLREVAERDSDDWKTKHARLMLKTAIP